MKLFELAWTWHEDYNFYLYVHPNKTEEEFKTDVQSLLVKYGNEYIQSTESWIGASDWIEFISDKMPELGYEPVNPIRSSFFGSYIIKGDDKQDENWGNIVGKELLDKAIAHNNEIEKEMDERIKS